MATRNTPVKIENGFHRTTGIQYEIFMMKKTGMFTCKVADRNIETASLVECRMEITNYLNSLVDIAWYPVIVVNYIEPFGSGNGMGETPPYIGLTIRRFQIGKRSQGKMLQCSYSEIIMPRFSNDPEPKDEPEVDWRTRDSKEFSLDYSIAKEARDSFDPAKMPFYTSKGVILAYTDETWQGLNALIEAIKALRLKVEAIVGTPEGLDHLIRVGSGQMAIGDGVKT